MYEDDSDIFNESDIDGLPYQIDNEIVQRNFWLFHNMPTEERYIVEGKPLYDLLVSDALSIKRQVKDHLPTIELSLFNTFWIDKVVDKHYNNMKNME